MNEIITINGKTYKKSDCRLIDKEYYLIGDRSVENSGDVYLIDGRYIRMNTGRLVFNNTSKLYQLKNDTLVHGIISMGNESDFIFGYFDRGIDNMLLVDKDKNIYTCINENIINRSFREELSTGTFYHISLKRAYQFNLIKIIKKEYKESLPYDSKGIMNKYIDNYNKNYNPVINSTIQKYSSVINNLTFGFEFETIKGILPENKLNHLPLIPLRDGSISGLEYVTIPLSGAKGIKALVDCVKELKKRTEYDKDCSLHLHIGNVPRTPEFILAFYKLITNYQEEIFSLFPLYKKYNFGVKRKNYSEPFPFNQINSKLEPSISVSNKEQIDRNFDVLFSHLSGGQSFYEYKCDLKNVKSHPLDPNGNQKWNIKKRYYAHNFIPLIFGNKETIEFRIHTPTYDIDKILNFLFINSYLINYAIINQDNLLNDPNFLDNKSGRSLDRFICNYSNSHIKLNREDRDSLVSYHLNYIDSRKIATYEDNCKGNIIGNEEDIYCHKLIDWEEILDLKYKIKFGSNIKNNYSINRADDFNGKAKTYPKLNGFKNLSIDQEAKPIKNNNILSFPTRNWAESDVSYKERISQWEKLTQMGFEKKKLEDISEQDVINILKKNTFSLENQLQSNNEYFSDKFKKQIDKEMFVIQDAINSSDGLFTDNLTTEDKERYFKGYYSDTGLDYLDSVFKNEVKDNKKTEEIPVKSKVKSKLWS